jgi:hypothetical protein
VYEDRRQWSNRKFSPTLDNSSMKHVSQWMNEYPESIEMDLSLQRANQTYLFGAFLKMEPGASRY